MKQNKQKRHICTAYEGNQDHNYLVQFYSNA